MTLLSTGLKRRRELCIICLMDDTEKMGTVFLVLWHEMISVPLSVQLWGQAVDTYVNLRAEETMSASSWIHHWGAI